VLPLPSLTNLFLALTCVPSDAQTGLRAGGYLRQYHRSHGVELGDALIGSAALLNGAALWTRNKKHYPMKDVSFY
jgi:predicted nucleic acid-binding protein